MLVDAHMVGTHETGNETYIVNLLQELGRLPQLRCGAALLPAMVPSLNLAGVDRVPLRFSADWFRLAFALPVACRIWRADVLHVTYVGPFWRPCPLVVSVHDVAFKRYADFFSPRDRLLFATLLPLTLRRANAVITISAHAQQEILKLFPYLEGKVHVTQLAPSPLFRHVSDRKALDSVRARYGIHSDFVLAVGNLQPRKNLLRLVRAFASVRAEIGPVQLVIVGKEQWKSSSLYETVRRLGLEREVIFPGYVPDENLVPLYSAARMLAYPSIYEGFGLPILEAMACGTPVVASNTSAMPEVAADAALLVDPYEQRQIARAIVELIKNRALALSLSERGLERARRFCWRKTAEKTLRVYENVAGFDPGKTVRGRN